MRFLTLRVKTEADSSATLRNDKQSETSNDEMRGFLHCGGKRAASGRDDGA